MSRRISGLALGLALIPLTLTPGAGAATHPDSGKRIVKGDGGLTDTRTPSTTRTRTKIAVDRPAAAARQFLASKVGTYHIKVDSLRTDSVRTEKGVTTVRLNQTYAGLPVVGAQYVVRMKSSDGANLVTGTSGAYFTAISPATTRTLDPRLAARAALRSLRVHWLRTPRTIDRGTVVVPFGAGVTARQVEVRGRDAQTRLPIRRQVFVNVLTGQKVFAYDEIKYDAPIDTTGPSAKGSAIPLKMWQNSAGRYELRDRTRPMWSSDGGEIITYDATGRDAQVFFGAQPKRPGVYSTATVPLTSNPGGVNDAHWGAGQVFDFFSSLGRNSIDGMGGSIHSYAGTTLFGDQFDNAFWNGSYMVYGGGTKTTRPFASSLDVVGHEMTHGVIEHSSNLLYVGQSGAINEAAADYFGNTIQNKVLNTPTGPGDGLLGEDHCLKLAPELCALRDLNAPTDVGDYMGWTDDNRGVHLNSPIISSAWWEIRSNLGAAVADPLVYKTLTQYLTPLSQFLDARDATIAAAQDSGFSAADVAVVQNAFDSRGIKANWEHDAIGVDYDPIRELNADSGNTVAAGGNQWVVDDMSPDFSAAYIYGGAFGTAGAKISPDSTGLDVKPATDGNAVAWLRVNPADMRVSIQRLELSSMAVSEEEVLPEPFVWQTWVDGPNTAYVAPVTYREDDIVVLRPDLQDLVIKPTPKYAIIAADVRDGVVAYAEADRRSKKIAVRLVDVATGINTKLATLKNSKSMELSSVAITADAVVFSLNKVMRKPGTGVLSVPRSGGPVTTLVPENSAALDWGFLSSNDDVVTISGYSSNPHFLDVELRQIPATGGTQSSVTCATGEKGRFATGGGTKVAWIDYTRGRAELVSRNTPAGTCG